MPPQTGTGSGGGGGTKRARGEGGKRMRGSGAAGTSGRGGGARSASTIGRRGGGGTGVNSNMTGGGGAGNSGNIGQGRRGPFVYRGEFRKDIEGLMYAFGDTERPDPDSVALMEDMTVSFLIDLCKRARPTPVQLSIPSNPTRVQYIAQADAQQRQLQNEQRLVDETAERAAAGSSAKALAKAQKRLAALNADFEKQKANEMMTRSAVHPYVGRSRLTVEDIKFACRKDSKMTSRIEELIYLDKEIASARKAFDVPADEAIQQENNATSTGAQNGNDKTSQQQPQLSSQNNANGTNTSSVPQKRK